LPRFRGLGFYLSETKTFAVVGRKFCYSGFFQGEIMARNKIELSFAGADPIQQKFLRWNFEQGTQFAAQSDIVHLDPQPTLPGMPPDRYLAVFRCNGLIHDGQSVRVGNQFAVGIAFPADYLVAPPNVVRILTLLTPNVWHPNVAMTAPVLCVGHITPGMTLVEHLYQLYEIFSWQKLATHDPLNPAAAQWARDPANRARFPVDRRPLKRRAIEIKAGAV
jgi:ubiquitin-protein ligase